MNQDDLKKLQEECGKKGHKGFWESAGQVQALGKEGIFLVTTLYCSNCGFMVYASQELNLPKSNIKPVSLNLRNLKN